MSLCGRLGPVFPSSAVQTGRYPGTRMSVDPVYKVARSGARVEEMRWRDRTVIDGILGIDVCKNTLDVSISSYTKVRTNEPPLPPVRRRGSGAGHAASRLLGWPSRASLPRGPRWLEHGCDLPHLGRGHVAEDVAIPLHDDAPLPGSFWKELGRALGNKPNAGTRGDRTAFLEMLEERAPTRLILL